MDPKPRVRGGRGVWLKAEKKVTSINLKLEVVSDVPVATSDSYSRVQTSLVRIPTL